MTSKRPRRDERYPFGGWRPRCQSPCTRCGWPAHMGIHQPTTFPKTGEVGPPMCEYTPTTQGQSNAK